MKLVSSLLLVCALAIGGFAQNLASAPQPTNLTNIYAAGPSFNSSGSPKIAGTALWAHLIADGSGTYGFTVVDAIPNSVSPFTVTTNVGAGIAQKVFTLGKVPIFVPTAVGISWNGSNAGWAWSTGAAGVVRVKGNFRIMPTLRVAKSSVSNGTGYQPIFTMLFGWGK